MRPSRTAKLVWILGPMFCVIAIVAYVSWGPRKPTIVTATRAEIWAVLPPELRVELHPEDKAAVARFKKLDSIAKSIDPRIAMQAQVDQSAGRLKRSKAIHQLWQSHPHFLTDLTALLEAGPIQRTSSKSGSEFNPDESFLAVARMLSTGAKERAQLGDFQSSSRMLRGGTNLADRLLSASVNYESYLDAVLVEGISSGAVANVLSTPVIPDSAIEPILSSLPPAPKQDEYLAAAIQGEFQRNTLKELSDPKFIRDLDVPGNYDAIETAQMLGRAIAVEIANARRPLSQFDFSAERKIVEQKADLPKRPLSSAPALARIRYGLQMSNIRNSLGREFMLNSTLAGPNFVEVSEAWRAERELLRIRLAARIYRASHGSQLPATTSGLVPILGVWPLDPYNGKPMIYDRNKELAYSVGPRLVDEGGTSSNPSKVEAHRVSLKL